MKNLHETQTWQVTLLTPLHIGDGVEMQENLDFVSNGKGLEVVDLDETLRAVAAVNHQALMEMGNKNFQLTRFLNDYKVDLKVSYTLPTASGTRINSLRRFIKNGLGLPYVPGSTLKGALRTALLSPLLTGQPAGDAANPSRRRYGDIEGSLKSAAGPDPNHDIFRSLQVSDSTVLLPEKVLRAEEVKFFNIAEGDKAGWKDFSSKRTVPKPSDAAGIYVEALKSGAVFHVQVALDGFLAQPAVRRALAFRASNGFDIFSLLARTIDGHSRRLALKERDFFRKYGVGKDAGAQAAASFLDRLIERMNGSGEEAFFLRLAWGSGWKGMTGDWIGDSDLQMVRQFKNLGKTGCPQCHSKAVKRKQYPFECQKCGHVYKETDRWLFPTFPKTRRLAMDGGLPALPLGWVQVKPVDRDVFVRESMVSGAGALEYRQPVMARSLGKESPVENAGTSDGGKSTESATSPKESESPEVLMEQKLEQFRQSLGATSNLVGEMVQFLDRVKAMDDGELKAKMTALLLEKARNLPKKKYSKSLADGKQWAVSLDALSRELKLVS